MKYNIVEVTLLILVIVLVVGFFFVLNQINSVDEHVSNLSLNMELLSNELREGNTPITPDATSTEPNVESPTSGSAITIPTAILFNTESSPLLQPQTPLTVSVEKATKEDGGIVRLYVRVFTNQADSYTAVDPGNLFELLNPSGANQKALKVTGQFDSMPPQSSITGEIIFKLPTGQSTGVFKIDTSDGAEYYEFNFTTRNYKEAVLG